MSHKERARFIAANISKKQYLQEQVCGKPSSDGVSAGVPCHAATHGYTAEARQLFTFSTSMVRNLDCVGGLTCPA